MIKDNHKPIKLLSIINDCEKFFICGHEELVRTLFLKVPFNRDCNY